jgi:hypothetical protein
MRLASVPGCALVLLAAGCGDSSPASDGGADGASADLAGADLAGVDLARRQPDLAGVDLAGAGLGAAHCGDVGIESDPAVLFVEKFDEGSIAQAMARWDQADNPIAMTLSTMAPPGSSGGSAKWHYASIDAYTVGFLKSLPPGHDTVYLRYYALVPQAADPIWHFFRLGGGDPLGGAGVKPDGTDRFATSLEPNYDRWKWDLYTYWVDMRPDSTGSFYGNNFLGEDFGSCKDVAPPVARDTWVALELMVKLNTVGKYDGEQAFWIDGQPLASSYSSGAAGAAQRVSDFGPGFPTGSWVTAHFCPDLAGQPFDGASGTPGNGFRWRTADTLGISYVRPLVYNDRPQPNVANDVYVANIVVATEYVGPIVACP